MKAYEAPNAPRSTDSVPAPCGDLLDQALGSVFGSCQFGFSNVLHALTSHICLLDEGGTILWVNGAWTDFMIANGGERAAMAVGSNYLEVCDRAVSNGDASARVFSEAIRKVLDGSLPRFELEYPCHGPDTKRWFRAEVISLRVLGLVQVVVAHHDLSEPRLMLEALQAREDDFRTVIDASPKVILLVDRQGRILTCNQQWLARKGGTLPEMIGREVFDLLYPGRRETWTQAFNRVIAGAESIETEDETDGLLWKTSFYPVHGPSGQVERVSIFSEDITERRRTEEALQHTQRLENTGLLAANIAHDFNNILMAVQGNLDLLGEAGANEALGRSGRGGIEMAILRGRDLCRQLMAYAGKEKVALTTLRLDEVLSESLALLRVSVPRHIRFQAKVDPAPIWVRACAQSLHQILMNLVMNAADAIGEAGGEIEIQTFRATLTQGDLDRLLPGHGLGPGRYGGFSVSDSGCGMAKEVLSRVTEPFFTTKANGHGLGLAALRGILRSHRGGLGIESTPGLGSRFWIYLPSAEGVESGETAQSPHPG